ncbi:MarR family winged helix-turn-helix transcriptional regulator [Streptomyces cinnabarinus]|uniref:MarR family winged helix-turn-helix transcriptional regulator n=1 Tax=Streptomyces cinnabarinus TaxID=67287 RepID=A0ABY7KQ70_9ACTN|nr:MarR family winged helix-turn-helix transcriptional regulator [Streptomyces cinnabarinus]WAZ26713.1 MarR family winged helix-turn-helix transcriptional regulator [Streptomyces cinnabarinus]
MPEQRAEAAAAVTSAPQSQGTARLSVAIFGLAWAHRAHAAGLLRSLRLHPAQELLLMKLLERDGQTQSELLESVSLDHSTVSKSLRRMQEAGLLTRQPAEHDRRVATVWLTDRGRDMREPIEAMWSALEHTSAQELDAEAIESFITVARTIEKSITRRSQ